MLDNTVRRSLSGMLALGLALGLSACEDDNDLIDTEEVFATDLVALNNSGVDGAATFRADEGGLFVASVEATGLAANQPHPQHIHAGAACPTADMDEDGDGLVELAEAAPAYGLILVPLDDQLADISAGDFPQGSVVDYEQSSTYSALLSAISGTDTNMDDNITTLGSGELNLSTRTVVLHGAFVMNGQVVPAGTEGAEYRATLPVACGTIVASD